MIRRVSEQYDASCIPCMLDGKYKSAVGKLNRECFWFVCEKHFISASAVGGFRAKRFDGSMLTPFEAVQLSKKKPG